MIHMSDVADTIEAHVTVAHDQVEDGREELIKAAAYQASSMFVKIFQIYVVKFEYLLVLSYTDGERLCFWLVSYLIFFSSPSYIF